MRILNLVRKVTDDCFENYLETSWSISCEDGVMIFPTGRYIELTGKVFDGEPETDISIIFEVFASLIRDEVEAKWIEETETLEFSNGVSFKFS